jgi:hypothetical protein
MASETRDQEQLRRNATAVAAQMVQKQGWNLRAVVNDPDCEWEATRGDNTFAIRDWRDLCALARGE